MDEKPVCFLDLDGCFNSELFYRSRKKFGGTELNREFHLSELDGEAVKIFNTFAIETGCEIVISSTWRRGHSLEELNSFLRERGLEVDAIDVTPIFNQSWAVRGNEIKAWLDENRHYTFDKYVILDDDSDMLLEQDRNFFAVDGYCGITPRVLYRAKRFLEKG